MRFPVVFLACLLSLFHSISATHFVKSSSLLTCMENSQFTAQYFDVKFYPTNRSVVFDVTALSNIDANVTAEVNLIAYGINVLTKNVSLCELKFGSICPLSTGRMELNSHYELPVSITKQIPGVAFTIPDLDARVRIVLHNSDSHETLACVEAVLTNGKTVQTRYAAWPIAAISGLGVVTSGVVSVIGHSNTAAHIASNSMSLFIYFQSLAITSMMAVAKIPPIAAAWAQNFVWSLGIVKVAFVQDIANWYMQSTGGSPTDILSSQYLSISVQKKAKRSLDFMSSAYDLFRGTARHGIAKRASISLDSDDFGYSDSLDSSLYTADEKDKDIQSKILILRGVQRVAYLTGIEITNFFMTGIIFLLFFAFVMVVCLTLFKAIIEILIRSKMMNEGKFNEYRQQWSHIVKGALYRLLMIAFPQIAVLCIWELYERDSAGTVVVAVFLLVITLILLCQAAARVFLLGRRSIRQFKNPAYLLFGDGVFLNKFGFVYVQYRADCYYFILVSLVYIFLKSLFVAVLQRHGKVQSVIVFAIELFYCIGLCVIRPFMDKRTNAFNIVIGVINCINALFFMFFSYIFKQPHVVASVMAVVYFVLNAAFALFLLLFTIITCVLALLYKNPDTRYQPMKDDRVSFLPRFDNPKQGGAKVANDDMELMALGATAMKGHEHGNQFEEDESAFEVDSVFHRNTSSKSSENLKSITNSDSINGKRDSYYLESIEPTQPNSTIVGNPGAVGNYGAPSSYNGSYGGQGSQNIYARNNSNPTRVNYPQNYQNQYGSAKNHNQNAYHGDYI